MSKHSSHPSRLVLDRVRLGERLDEVADHVATCEVCRDYVEDRPVARVPSWVHSLDEPRWWPRMLFRAAPVAAVAFAALAAVWLRVGVQGDSPEPYVGVKAAAPVVEVYLRTADRVEAWSHQALNVGDRIQLRIMPSGFAHVSVLAQAAGGLVVLHQQEVSASDRFATLSLSRSFRVDDSDSKNELIVLLSREPLKDSALQNLPLHSTPNIWVRRLSFTEESSHE